MRRSKTGEDKSAEVLVAKVKAGSLSAFEQLYDTYSALIFHIAYNILLVYEDAEDARQEVFLKALRSIMDYKWQPQTDSSFRAWLCRIAVNWSIDVYRRRGRMSNGLPPPDQGSDEPEELVVVGNDLTPEELAIRREQSQIVRQAIHEITPDYREVMMRYYFGYQSVLEIAEDLNMPKNTIKTWLYRGRQEMKHKLMRAGIGNLD